MRSALLGLAVGAAVAAWTLFLVADRQPAFGQRPAEAAECGELLAFHTPLGDKLQQLTVIDPKRRTVGVYHVDAASGQVTLRSVRNIHWDMQLLEFNGSSPHPQDIQHMLGLR